MKLMKRRKQKKIKMAQKVSLPRKVVWAVQGSRESVEDYPISDRSKIKLLCISVVLCIINLFQKVERIIKSTIYKLYVICTTLFVNKTIWFCYGQTIHGFHDHYSRVFANNSTNIALLVPISPNVTPRFFPVQNPLRQDGLK